MFKSSHISVNGILHTATKENKHVFLLRDFNLNLWIMNIIQIQMISSIQWYHIIYYHMFYIPIE